MQGRHTTTQRDVALRAGVSQATVSAALNRGRGTVAADTAARIDAAIEDLGYRPNRFAQALRTQKSMTVACVVPDLGNPFYPAFLAAAQNVLTAANYDVVAIDSGGSAAIESGAVTKALQGRYDGLFGVFFHLRLVDFRPMIEAGIGLVRVEAKRKPGGMLPFDDIFVDHRAAARVMTEQLIALGHRRIATVAGTGGPQSVRVSGYCDALARHGIAPSIWVDPMFTEVGGRRATEAMLASGARPTAVVAANDLLAIGTMQALIARNLSVPGDVSVTGCDDIMAASLVSPPLTTVAMRQDRLGATAAQALLARLRGENTGPGRAIEMPFEIVCRGSVAAPPGEPQSDVKRGGDER